MWFWSIELIFRFTIFLENSMYLYKHIFLLKPLVHNCVGTTFLSKFSQHALNAKLLPVQEQD